MSDWWTTRQLLEPEEMDAPGVDRERLIAALRFIRRVNGLLRYTRSTLRHLDQFTRNWPAGRPIRILDVATGSADVPQALARWAKQSGKLVQIVGLDLHEQTLEYAQQHSGEACGLVRGDALRLPFEDASFDFVMTSMFLHHLTEQQVIGVLREMNRVASCAIVAADLARGRRAYAWISLFTVLADPMVRHDARVSVRQAFRPAEMRQIAERAGLMNLVVTVHFGHRFVLTASAAKPANRSGIDPSGL